MIWFRLDNRLIHGQIIEAWLPYTRANHLVVCNAELAQDELRQQIMQLAVPSRITVAFVAPGDLNALLQNLQKQDAKTLVIFSDCTDARTAYDAETRFSVLNIGNMHYASGKQQICGHVALSPEDASCLHTFADAGVRLDFRCVPNDKTEVTNW